QFPQYFHVWFSRHERFIDLGTYYYAKGDYQTALDFLLKARKIDEEEKDGYRGFLEPARLALVYQAIGNSDLAFENFALSDDISAKNLAGAFNLYTERARIQNLQAALPANNWIISFAMLQNGKRPKASQIAFLS